MVNSVDANRRIISMVTLINRNFNRQSPLDSDANSKMPMFALTVNW